jgi:hypothetical protein
MHRLTGASTGFGKLLYASRPGPQSLVINRLALNCRAVVELPTFKLSKFSFREEGSES